MQLIKRLFWLLFIFILVIACYKFFDIYRDMRNVLQYQSLVQEELVEINSTADEDLILAIIYTETKGNLPDLMQSSESATGQVNSITDNRESVRQGIATLSQNFDKAQQLDLDIWIAVQAYNFGQAYLDYVAEHGLDNTIAVATSYSRDVVAPSLGNTTGEAYFYYHPIALLNGGKLYVNGGNIYYSRQVKFNLGLLRIFKFLSF